MESGGPNSQQLEYWNGQAGPKWVRLQSFLDGQLQPFGHAAMDRMGDIGGKSILDVGCGCGSTTLEIGRRVGAAGSVLGVDLSLPMLEQARAVAAQKLSETQPGTGSGQVSFQQADAQCDTFEAAFDGVFSRFGVMFFADPVRAFTNLRTSMKVGGRLSMICWQSIDRNQWMMVPVQAALQHLPPPEMPAVGAPGPFSLSDPDRTRGIMDDSGFHEIDVAAYDTTMVVGEGYSLAEITDLLMEIGPTSRLLKEASPQLRSTVSDSVRDALAPFHRDDAVRMAASAWLVSARA